MIVSRLDLEAVAAAITKDFFQVYYGGEVGNPNRFVLATPMNALAKDYLGLKVSYAPLSPDGSICGLTSYSDTSYTIRIYQQPYAIQLKRNQVILDMSFRNCERNSGLFKRRRFTLARMRAPDTLPARVGQGEGNVYKRVLSTEQLSSVRTQNPRGLERVAGKCPRRGDTTSENRG